MEYIHKPSGGGSARARCPKPERTPGNHRRYRTLPKAVETLTVGYVRVSSHDQKEDLERQKAAVKSQAGKPVDLIISDLGSGLNYKKAGFRQRFLLILQGEVRELILTHKDRLVRFGSEIIFQICQFCGVKITILNDAPENRTWNSSALIWWKS